jgi:hypothetical protein
LLAGDGEAGGRIKAAAEEADGGFWSGLRQISV